MTDYHLTVIVGETDCPVNKIRFYEKEFNEEKCVINLDHNNNHICNIVVHQSWESKRSRSIILEFLKSQDVSHQSPLFALDMSPGSCKNVALSR